MKILTILYAFKSPQSPQSPQRGQKSLVPSFMIPSEIPGDVRERSRNFINVRLLAGAYGAHTHPTKKKQSPVLLCLVCELYGDELTQLIIRADGQMSKHPTLLLVSETMTRSKPLELGGLY